MSELKKRFEIFVDKTLLLLVDVVFDLLTCITNLKKKCG